MVLKETVTHLLMESMPCGCRCTGRSIDFCPKHEAADAMLNELAYISRNWERWVGSGIEVGQEGRDRDELQLIRAALDKALGKTTTPT